MERCFLALGSNLGDRESQLRRGLAGLAEHGVRTLRCASIYSTEPKGYVSQPWFLNTAVEAETSLEPDALLRVCLAVEHACGRQRRVPDGPRTLDVDIVFFAARVIETPELVIPHPRYSTRRFVLEPLAEIAPKVVDPVSGRSVEELLRTLSDPSRVIRVAPPVPPQPV